MRWAYVGGLAAHHALGALLGGRVFRWALDIEDTAAFRKQRGELPGLDSANFHMIVTDAKNGSLGCPAELGNVTGFTIQDHPADIGGNGGFGDLRKRSPTDRFEDNRGGPFSGRRLDSAEQLRALTYGVVACVKDLQIQIKPLRHFFGGLSLFDLVVVIVGGERNQNAKFCHSLSPAAF